MRCLAAASVRESSDTTRSNPCRVEPVGDLLAEQVELALVSAHHPWASGLSDHASYPVGREEAVLDALGREYSYSGIAEVS